MKQLVSLLKPMKERIDGLMERLDIPSKSSQIDDIQAEASAPDFWDDPENAQKRMQIMSRLKDEVERWQSVANRINDALELAELDDADLEEELTKEVDALTITVDRLGLQALLSGPHDREDAILAIHAGSGGTDSQD